MSASLLVLIPAVLLGVVTLLCFVGCGLPITGLPQDPGPYEGAVIINPNLIACWPLDDTAKDLPVANDLKKKFNGTYPSGPQGMSSFMILRKGIVPGDVQPGGAASTCAFFNGGFVTVPFHPELNPSDSFTLEAWVLPGWQGSGSQRAVAVSASADEGQNPTANAGYGLVATDNNLWSAQIGVGTTFVAATSSTPIVLDGATTYYLAMTFDKTTGLTLFVGIVGSGLTPTPPTPLGAGQNFVAEQPGTTATPLFIGMGRPDKGGMYPFDGFIQDVAFYNPALSETEIKNHFALGGKAPG